MNINEYQWTSMIINECQWIAMNITEYQWISMDINEYQWISMDVNQGISMDINEYKWIRVKSVDNVPEISEMIVFKKIAFSTVSHHRKSSLFDKHEFPSCKKVLFQKWLILTHSRHAKLHCFRNAIFRSPPVVDTKF